MAGLTERFVDPRLSRTAQWAAEANAEEARAQQLTPHSAQMVALAEAEAAKGASDLTRRRAGLRAEVPRPRPPAPDMPAGALATDPPAPFQGASDLDSRRTGRGADVRRPRPPIPDMPAGLAPEKQEGQGLLDRARGAVGEVGDAFGEVGDLYSRGLGPLLGAATTQINEGASSLTKLGQGTPWNIARASAEDRAAMSGEEARSFDLLQAVEKDPARYKDLSKTDKRVIDKALAYKRAEGSLADTAAAGLVNVGHSAKELGADITGWVGDRFAGGENSFAKAMQRGPQPASSSGLASALGRDAIDSFEDAGGAEQGGGPETTPEASSLFGGGQPRTDGLRGSDLTAYQPDRYRNVSKTADEYGNPMFTETVAGQTAGLRESPGATANREAGMRRIAMEKYNAMSRAAAMKGESMPVARADFLAGQGVTPGIGDFTSEQQQKAADLQQKSADRERIAARAVQDDKRKATAAEQSRLKDSVDMAKMRFDGDPQRAEQFVSRYSDILRQPNGWSIASRMQDTFDDVLQGGFWDKLMRLGRSIDTTPSSAGEGANWLGKLGKAIDAGGKAKIRGDTVDGNAIGHENRLEILRLMLENRLVTKEEYDLAWKKENTS